MRAVWLVDPKRQTITVYRALTNITILTENDSLDGRDIIPGFSCAVAEVFALIHVADLNPANMSRRRRIP